MSQRDDRSAPGSVYEVEITMTNEFRGKVMFMSSTDRDFKIHVRETLKTSEWITVEEDSDGNIRVLEAFDDE